MTKDKFTPTQDEELAVSQMAQASIDEVIAECRKTNSDPIPAIKGVIAYSEEVLHWARETLAALEKEEQR